MKERLRNKEARYEGILINRFRRRKSVEKEKRNEEQEKRARTKLD